MEARCSFLLLIVIAFSSIIEVIAKSQYTTMYVFGDSLSDPGNNEKVSANYWPYGIDFDKGPTGRFCNGKLLVDFLGELLGFPVIPSYADTIANGSDVLSGVNYASSGSGILEDSGYALGRVIPFGKQIDNLKNTMNQLENQMQTEELNNYLAKALVFVAIGSNDYINNYMIPVLYKSSLIYDPQQYADLLVQLYKGHILELHTLGLRKFYLTEIPPVGCIPIELTIHVATPSGECDSSSNNLVQMFNIRLKSLVYNLNSENLGSIFTLGASYKILNDLRDNADSYGFKVKDKTCCRIGNTIGKLICLPKEVPCFNRDEYLFWDFAHPTQAANRILARVVYNGTSSGFPVNIQEMAEM
ncbi:hypothetical protein BUALT_Bualt04G0002000 [Buddleja alternifolia]|uniref:GDSL esterase/lipase n=1 Tax=Buddleja alternifolia TaxID=168488 RepID=A0AAV6XRP1_9LAMI|nr:hypothetical protein BUALT_Bualt04G0002000 [Buddleja alternifolia]